VNEHTAARGTIAKNENTKISVSLSGLTKWNIHAMGMKTKRTFNHDEHTTARKLWYTVGCEVNEEDVNTAALGGAEVLRDRRLDGRNCISTNS
jgi:hypothetical protein